MAGEREIPPGALTGAVVLMIAGAGSRGVTVAVEVVGANGATELMGLCSYLIRCYNSNVAGEFMLALTGYVHA